MPILTSIPASRLDLTVLINGQLEGCGHFVRMPSRESDSSDFQAGQRRAKIRSRKERKGHKNLGFKTPLRFLPSTSVIRLQQSG
jgi:hypothetical protein